MFSTTSLSNCDFAVTSITQPPLMTTDPLIMVIEGAEARGRNIKELIEFMDVPRVRIARVETWREKLGDRRLAAIFVGDDLEAEALEQIIRDVGDLDPNTAIVRVSRDGDFEAGD